jgi:RNA-splicing ligase RtcB
MSGRELIGRLGGQGMVVGVSRPALLAQEALCGYKDISHVIEAREGAGVSKIVARLASIGAVIG